MMKYFARVSSLIIFFLMVALLTSGYMHNSWNTVGRKWFVEWQTTQDTYFVGRLVQSRQAGVLSYAGLLGHGDLSRFSDQAEVVQHQYDVYLDQGSFAEFNSYNSAIDAQGILFGLFDKYTGFPPEQNLFFFQGMTSILSASILAMLVIWLYMEFGILSAILAGTFMILSEWLTLFGGSVYWSLWSNYLPLIASLYYFQQNQSDSKSGGNLAPLVFLTILIKCLFNGFAYITTILIMAYSPLIYYALINNWGRKSFIDAFLKMAVAEFLAILSALGILIYQNSVVLGGFDKALAYVVYSLDKRSIGDPNAFTGALAESLRASPLFVLKGYVMGRAIKLDLAFLSSYFSNWDIKAFDVSYAIIFSIFLVVSLLFFMLRKENGGEKRAKISSFMITTWLSMLAPLSWFIIFKAHSYLHYHLNFIIWQMPFALFGFGMCGAIIQSLVTRATKQ